MILSVVEEIKEFFINIPMFIEENYSNPLFWIIIAGFIIIITFFAINHLGEK